ncbi:glycosyltransferase family 2 protein [Pseudothioglobus sp. nBUS_23]|uniref:glycosyltransferase family 2 protein n=1 Tax=Pseudothioglobus sp. nBUS_23 TaxID=3395318 RepID=UPI003EBCBE86
MRISLIITTYNQPESLFLVLKSIEKQTLKPSEIIIADDGSSDSTKNLITEFFKDSDLNFFHSYQEDLGFRAAQSRNKAIAIASSEYIVLIDGDMILHPEFISDHLKHAKSNFFIQGSRALLTEQKTYEVMKKKQTKINFFQSGIKNRLNSIHSNIFSKFFSLNKNYLKGIKTCNMSFFREDCINVNGFNNDFIGWGREDTEFVVRLMNKGINRKSLKLSAIQFHLWHNEASRKSLQKNDLLLHKAIEQKMTYCKNGISKFL